MQSLKRYQESNLVPTYLTISILQKRCDYNYNFTSICCYFNYNQNDEGSFNPTKTRAYPIESQFGPT